MRKIAVGIGLVLLAGVAQAATWNVIRNIDCTALGVATGTTAIAGCCRIPSGGSAAPANFCDERTTAGNRFMRSVTLATGATQTYTTTGDVLTTSNLQRIGLTGGIISGFCSTAQVGATGTLGYNVAIVPSAAGPKIMLYETATTGDGPHKEATAAQDISNTSTNCIFLGY